MDFLSALNPKRPALIMSLPANDPDLAKIAADFGADVIKVHMNVAHRASGVRFGTFEEEKENLIKIREFARRLPLGVVAGSGIEDVHRDFRFASQIGYDFVSLYAYAAPMSVMSHPGMKKMIALAPGYRMSDVRLLPKIGADVLEASVMEPETYGQRMSAKELLEYAAIAEASRIPVVVPTQRKILPEEIGNLASVGISGIMIGAVVTGKEAESIKRAISEFRNAIDKL